MITLLMIVLVFFILACILIACTGLVGMFPAFIIVAAFALLDYVVFKLLKKLFKK